MRANALGGLESSVESFLSGWRLAPYTTHSLQRSVSCNEEPACRLTAHASDLCPCRLHKEKFAALNQLDAL